MEERGYPITSQAERKLVDSEIKERWAYVAMNFEQEMQKMAAGPDGEKDIQMPDFWDEEVFKVGTEL